LTGGEKTDRSVDTLKREKLSYRVGLSGARVMRGALILGSAQLSKGGPFQKVSSILRN